MQCKWYYDEEAASALQLCRACSVVQEAHGSPSWQRQQSVHQKQPG